jgi:cell division protein FtsI (penicillin-binding protein 3)
MPVSEADGRDPTARRLVLFVSFLILCMAALIVRYTTFMIVDGHPSGDPVVRLPEVERGPILDRNGRVLAVTIERDSVSAWAPSVTDPQAAAALLAGILDMRVEEVRRLLAGDGFVYVKRHITPDQSAAIRAALDRGELGGIDLRSEQARSYPEGELAAHVLGFVGVDNVGLEGIENTYNHVLAPDTIASDGSEVFGNQVFLTLDVNVQHGMERLAAEARSEHDADAVYIMVAAAATGEILAYAAQPSFDPNAYAQVPKERWRNAIATMPYEPGSVFKIFTMASLLQSGAITPTMTFPSPGYYRRTLPGGGTIRIGDLGVYGQIDAENILRYSSNAGTAHASDQIDAATFHHLLRTFGFGTATGSPFPGESPGTLRDIDQWSGRTKPTVAIGQEISVTALQVMQGASAFANDGILLRPQLVREVVAGDGTVVKPFAPDPVRQVIDPEVAARVLGMMETVATKGTGRLAQLDGYRIATKTGTAQVFDRASGTYSDEHLIASILGILPADDPRFIAYVVIQHPRGDQRYGGLIAAPLLKKVAAFLTTYYRMPPDGADPVLHPAHIVVSATPRLAVGEAVPDLTGMPMRRLLPLLERDDMKVALHGSGYVTRQDPAPGSPLSTGSILHIWLS